MMKAMNSHHSSNSSMSLDYLCMYACLGTVGEQLARLS